MEESPLGRLLNNHYEEFEYTYDDQYEKRYGFFRPVVRDIVGGYLKCSDLKEGFARVKCTDCQTEYFLAFSCKGRWFCPSCHNKKVARDDVGARERVAQYIIRNAFSVANILYNDKTGTVIYKADMY